MKLGKLMTFVLFAACGSSNTGGNPGQMDAPKPPPDSKVYLDAAPMVPAMITISGTAAEGGSGGSSTPQQGVAMSVYSTTNESTPLGTAMTDAQGKYSITITTNGQPVDGFVKAVKGGYKTSYFYPPGSWFKDSSADVNMITPGNFGLVPVIAGASQDSSKGMVALGVLDASSNPVAGATVSTNPTSDVRYASSGVPSSSATATDTDGFAFLFNVPGQVTISGAKSGATFKSHPVNAHPDSFTVTVITE